MLGLRSVVTARVQGPGHSSGLVSDASSPAGSPFALSWHAACVPGQGLSVLLWAGVSYV